MEEYANEVMLEKVINIEIKFLCFGDICHVKSRRERTEKNENFFETDLMLKYPEFNLTMTRLVTWFEFAFFF